MLPRADRLISNYDFARVKKLGKVLTTPLFVVSYLERPAAEASSRLPRFGFVTTTHLDKRATRRNRAKRLVREAARLFLRENFARLTSSAFDVVFVLRKNIFKASYEEINLSVHTLLPKVFKL